MQRVFQKSEIYTGSMKVKKLREKIYPYKRALSRCWGKIPKNPEQIYQGIFGVPVFANGIPKCGTHLLQSTINELSSFNFLGFCEIFNNADEVILQRRGEVLKRLRKTRKGAFYYGHLEPEPDILDVLKEKGFRTLLIIRDPRDLVCSHIFHAQKDDYRFCNHFKFTLTSDEDRIMASIAGLPAKFAEGSYEPLWDINRRYSSFMPWLNQDINLTVRFEDLIGPKGGGDHHTQISTLTGVADHLGLKLSSKKISKVADRLYNPKSLTFRKGRTGGWKEMFNYEHKEVFKELAGELLIELGYEKDMDW